MQRGASFNLEAVKAEIEARVKAMKAGVEVAVVKNNFGNQPPGSL